MAESYDQGELFSEPKKPQKSLTREELQELAHRIGENADRQRREAEQAGRPLDQTRRSAVYDDLGGRLPEPTPEEIDPAEREE